MREIFLRYVFYTMMVLVYAVATAAAGTPAPMGAGFYIVDFKGDRLSVFISGEQPFRKIIEAVAHKTGIRIISYENPEEKLQNIRIDDLPLKQGFYRLFNGRNYAYLYQDKSSSIPVKIYIFPKADEGQDRNKARIIGEDSLEGVNEGIREKGKNRTKEFFRLTGKVAPKESFIRDLFFEHDDVIQQTEQNPDLLQKVDNALERLLWQGIRADNPVYEGLMLGLEMKKRILTPER